MRRQMNNLKRKQNYRKVSKTILIVCEGEKTEKNYFESFRKDLHNSLINIQDVKIIGTGYNTCSLVQKAKDLRIELKKEGKDFEITWVVFDKDSFASENFNKAIDSAKKCNIRVAYSNEAFELWYLLHYAYIDAGLSRDQYKEKLTTRLGFKYEKNSKSMYSTLLDRQTTAIINAKKLIEHHKTSNPNGLNPERDNPSTTVHELVEELNKYRK
ncbi:MAG: RloB domain-containing protein [Nitrospirae bacterium]|nr:RloB domain-containing protein [Nitrospirota bacterium]MBF0534464.1 RloB domain-containing protein [Nitrospirota bacterium]MBF0617090.1 RloB domain-containing protein [Nitrospirota bacterium]